MSEPSFSNIDQWLFELEEGNLSPAQVQQLEMFLFQYPEFYVDKDVWKMAKISPTEMVFPNQDALIKKREFGWFYIASVTSIFLLFFAQLSSFSNFSSETVGERISQQSLIKKLLVKEIEEIRTIAKNTSVEIKEINRNTEKVNSSTSLPVNGIVENERINKRLIAENEVDYSEMNTKNYSSESNYSPLTEKKDDIIHTIDAISNQEHITSMYISRESTLTFLPEISFVTPFIYKNKAIKKSPSFQKKMKSFARKIDRMANNPVALRNYRDPNFHIPGLLNNDVNFSSTGSLLANRFQALSRIQWLGKENEQFMNQIAFDGYSNLMKGGVGLQLNHTRYANGGVNVSYVAVTYSPKLSLTKTVTFEPSVRFKMGKKMLNYSRMENVNQVEIGRQNTQSFYTQGQTPTGQNLWYKDLGVGLMMNTEWFFVSAQVDNLFRHKDNIYENDFDNPRRADFYYSFSVGTDWVSQNKKMSFSPYFVYQNNEDLSEGWLGANYRLNWFTIGAGVSTLMDPTASIGVKFKHFSFQYTADYLTSDMTKTRALSHQVTLRIVGKPNRFGKRILNL